MAAIPLDGRTWEKKDKDSGKRREVLISEMSDKYLDAAIKNCIKSHIKKLRYFPDNIREMKAKRLASTHKVFWMIEELSSRGKSLEELEEFYWDYHAYFHDDCFYGQKQRYSV